MRHEVTIEPYLGETSKGSRFGAAATVRCFVDEQTRTVRSPGGDDVTSGSTVFADPGTQAPPGSRVRLPSGRVTRVIQLADHDGGGLPTPDHVEIHLE
ncbi:hypothetical protein JK361_25920 [Streptomyces sp. 5-8]|uniref:Uncharacterized protein n=2 Tax=Streptomyces musisoli TaxID=2802280 RepID=A0ABS1P746_9ACTN|nr:hypothetical protein [Streptomyces musisoli]